MEMTNDGFCAEIAARYPKAARFVSKRPHACTILCIENDLCRLIYCGETIPDQIEDVFSQAVAAGHTSAQGGMLVDFTHFSGCLDWDYAKKRKKIAPGIKTQPTKVAYIMPGEVGVKTAKILTFWLKQYECRVFNSTEDADRWLSHN